MSQSFFKGIVFLVMICVACILLPQDLKGDIVPPDDPDQMLLWMQEEVKEADKGLPPLNPEAIYGPTNVNAVAGNGRLSVGLSRQGEITVLRWPTPSNYDQIDYRATDFYEPRMGAPLNAGSFAGAILQKDGQIEITWFRGPGWSHYQRYLSDDTSIIVTVMVNTALGLTVTQTDFVLPDQDVLVRHYDVVINEDAEISSAALVYFGNFNPCRFRAPYIPAFDWLFEWFNDFAVAYTATDDALIHFRPRTADEDRIAPYMGKDQAVIDGMVSNLDAIYPPSEGWGDPGIYIALKGSSPSIGHQCGLQTEKGGVPNAGAFWDVMNDGQLSGNPLSLGFVSGAMSWDLSFESGKAFLTLAIALADSAAKALDLADETISADYDDLLLQTRMEWTNWMLNVNLPDSDDEGIVRTAKRSLQALRIGTHVDTACMVASLSCQPPYYLDWPRDGALMNFAWDLAGKHDLVTRHNLYYTTVQRPVTGTYNMNYYPDGMPGGPLILEIDQEGILNYSMWDHARYLDGDQREAYLKAVYPAMAKTSDFLVFWRDPFTGLQFYSFEADALWPVQNITGAMAVQLGLLAAIEAGQELGEEAGRLTCWLDRYEELREAILEHYWDEETGAFEPGFGSIFALYPRTFFEEGDPRNDSHADFLWESLQPLLNTEKDFGSYDWMVLVALGDYWRDDPEKFEMLDRAFHLMMVDIPTRDTHHYGEGFVIYDTEEGAIYENHVAMPHLGAHSQVYLASMLFYGAAEPGGDDDDSGDDDDREDDDYDDSGNGGSSGPWPEGGDKADHCICCG